MKYIFDLEGVRSEYSRPNYFDDKLFLTIGFENCLEEHVWPITTCPGIPWLKAPMNDKGCAILVAGIYENAYELGTYKGYEALKQVKPVKVYRDNNRDSEINRDSGTIEEGMFGIHFHRAGWLSSVVGLSSAGCQVFQKRADFEQFIYLCKRAAAVIGNGFTYKLSEEA